MTSQQPTVTRPFFARILGAEDRRQGYRIDPEFQSRFRATLLAFSVLILTGVALLTSGVLWIVQNPEAVPTSLWVPASMFGLAVAIGMMIFYLSDRISHRYCGPVYRISNTLEAARRGERPATIRLRKGDEFQALAETVNATLRELGAMDDDPQ